MSSDGDASGARPPLALVYGGGGPYAAGFGMGVAGALLEYGVPLRRLPALATSGGAWAAAAVLAQLDHDRVLTAMDRVHLPDLRPGRLLGLAVELWGTQYQRLLWTSALRLPRLTRALMWGGSDSVAEIVAASSSVLLMTAPQRVGRRYYVDGGTRSWVSAHLAPSADRLLVIAPGVTPAIGRFGPALASQLAFEIRRWRRRTGGEAHVVRPPAVLGRRARRWNDLFDRGLARDAYAQAHDQTLRELASDGTLRAFTSVDRRTP